MRLPISIHLFVYGLLRFIAYFGGALLTVLATKRVPPKEWVIRGELGTLQEN